MDCFKIWSCLIISTFCTRNFPFEWNNCKELISDRLQVVYWISVDVELSQWLYSLLNWQTCEMFICGYSFHLFLIYIDNEIRGLKNYSFWPK